MVPEVRDRTKVPVPQSKSTCFLYVCHGAIKRYGVGVYSTCIRNYSTAREGAEDNGCIE